MFGKSSKEQMFFDFFIEMSQHVSKAAIMLEDLMKNYVNVESKIKQIEQVEHECDTLVHRIMQHLNASFITPIDREDICAIAKQLDNIIDDIESTAHRFSVFDIRSVRSIAVEMAELIVKCTKELEFVISELKNMKKSRVLKDKLIEVNRLEGEGDAVFRQAVMSLFNSNTPTEEIIEWKEIFEYLENTLDSCEDVADVVEGIVTKHN